MSRHSTRHFTLTSDDGSEAKAPPIVKLANARLSVISDVGVLEQAAMQFDLEREAGDILCGKDEFEALGAAIRDSSNVLKMWSDHFGIEQAVALRRVVLIQALANLPTIQDGRPVQASEEFGAET